jgi:Family of unknown function (DUF6308)
MRSIEPSQLKQNICRVVDNPRAQSLVSAYFDVERYPNFAGHDFDRLGRGENRDNDFKFTSNDLLSLCLLDIRPRPEAIRQILAGSFDHVLEGLTPGIPIWHMTDELYDNALVAWTTLTSIKYLGSTATSKILSRKRPDLIPIQDSVIERVLGIGKDAWWKSLRDVLRDNVVRDSIDTLYDEKFGPRPSTLRILDVATWMLGSNSREVKKIRSRLRAPDL